MSSSRIPPSIGGIHLSDLSDFPGPPQTAFAELLEDIQALHDNVASRENIAISQPSFDKWVGNLQQQVVNQNDPTNPKKPRGRPSFDWDIFRIELLKRDTNGSIFNIDPLNKVAVCEVLHTWYAATFPYKPHPKTGSIRKALQNDLDRIFFTLK